MHALSRADRGEIPLLDGSSSLYACSPYLYMYTFYLSVYSIFNGLEALGKHGVSGRVLGSRMMFSCQALRAFTA